jgi:hypothetical protein
MEPCAAVGEFGATAFMHITVSRSITLRIAWWTSLYELSFATGMSQDEVMGMTCIFYACCRSSSSVNVPEFVRRAYCRFVRALKGVCKRGEQGLVKGCLQCPSESYLHSRVDVYGRPRTLYYDDVSVTAYDLS